MKRIEDGFRRRPTFPGARVWFAWFQHGRLGGAASNAWAATRAMLLLPLVPH